MRVRILSYPLLIHRTERNGMDTTLGIAVTALVVAVVALVLQLVS